MIRVEELSYGVPAKDLYKSISFEIETGKHCALIGVNGTGKSTLANIIINPEEYLYDGKIFKDDSCRIGYANQFSLTDKERDITVMDYLSERFLKIQQEIAEVCEELATAEDMEAALEKYQNLLDLNEAMDGDNYESNIVKQLYAAKLLTLKDTPLSQISGSEYKVIQIVKEMLLAPNLLVLDEPDAFLDFENLNSLCKLINDYKGTMLVITHNRYLLNHCFNKILHLESGDLQEYDGSYTEYRCAQLRGKLELKRQHLEEQEEIDRTQEMVDILRKRATMMVNPVIGRSVNAKQSQLDRLRSRHIDAPVFEIREPEIAFPEVTPLKGKVVLSVKDYSVKFDDCYLEDVNFDVLAGEKVAIIGADGQDKAALVRDIIGGTHPAVTIDEESDYAVLSQLQGNILDGEKTVHQFMQDKGFGDEDNIRRYLVKCCLDEVNLRQKVSSLSVGEQSLLQIAAIANSKSEFLILDEPTSHLDVYTQIALETAVSEYKGTVLIISHDFYLVANCSDYVLLIEDNTVRRMRGRKFRKMVYDKYFDQQYLEVDKKRQELEAAIAKAFKDNDLDSIEKYCTQLEEVSMNK